jgi:hypothetical protein
MTKGRGWRQQRCNFGRSGKSISGSVRSFSKNERHNFGRSGKSISESEMFSKDR